ncbi:MAG: recombinase zinc beta ribbon domain-containing protein [Anaerolineae bacterium]
MKIIGARERTLRRWVPDPHIWRLVRQAWDMRLRGASYNEIADATGLYKSVNCWPTFFANPIYKGELHFCGVLIPVEAAVTAEEWERVNARKMPPSGGPDRRRATSRFLLSGLAFCARCGAPLNGGFTVAGIRNDGAYRKEWRYYVCTRRKRERTCDLPQLGAEPLEATVLDTLLNHFLTEDTLSRARREILNELENERPSLEQRAEALRREARDLERVMDNLLAAIEQAPDVKPLTDRLRERQAAFLIVQRDLAEVEAKLAGPSDAPVDIESLREELQEQLAHAPPHEVRALLAKHIERITADEEVVRIRCRLPF